MLIRIIYPIKMFPRYSLLSLIHLAFLVNALKAEGPLEPCEINDQLVADSYSCTRYHVCRQLEGQDEFTTDIAICPPNHVFDMVTSDCVDSGTGYLQDPDGCNTFYGCHGTKETSEGFIRRAYTCPGDLRFDPVNKHCTFKTKVTDDLCNSRDPDQRIIGNLNRIQIIEETRVQTLEENRNSGTRDVLPETSHYTHEYRVEPQYTIHSEASPEYLEKVTNGALRVSPEFSKGNHEKSISQDNLSRIAQVIAEQLSPPTRNKYGTRKNKN